MRGFLLLFILLLPLAASGMEAKVVKVADGDTLTIETFKGRRVRVRLYAIDAPERGNKKKPGQPYSAVSGDNLARLCLGEIATIELMDVDTYGRLVAVVYCQGVNANLRQVEDGYAWVYDYFAKKDNLTAAIRHYYEAEAAARAEKRGLWQGDPLPPWEWRAPPR